MLMKLSSVKPGLTFEVNGFITQKAVMSNKKSETMYIPTNHNIGSANRPTAVRRDLLADLHLTVLNNHPCPYQYDQRLDIAHKNVVRPMCGPHHACLINL